MIIEFSPEMDVKINEAYEYQKEVYLAKGGDAKVTARSTAEDWLKLLVAEAMASVLTSKLRALATGEDIVPEEARKPEPKSNG